MSKPITIQLLAPDGKIAAQANVSCQSQYLKVTSQWRLRYGASIFSKCTVVPDRYVSPPRKGRPKRQRKPAGKGIGTGSGTGHQTIRRGSAGNFDWFN